jgi:uncharacterized protein YjbI with pentapeptide repeats
MKAEKNKLEILLDEIKKLQPDVNGEIVGDYLIFRNEKFTGIDFSDMAVDLDHVCFYGCEFINGFSLNSINSHCVEIEGCSITELRIVNALVLTMNVINTSITNMYVYDSYLREMQLYNVNINGAVFSCLHEDSVVTMHASDVDNATFCSITECVQVLFECVSISNSTFANCKIGSKWSFDKCEITNSNFNNTELNDVNFTRCNLGDTQFDGRCKLTGVNMTDVSLMNSIVPDDSNRPMDVRYCTFTRCKFMKRNVYADMHKCVIDNCVCIETDLRSCSITLSNISGVTLYNANTSWTYIEMCSIKGCSFINTRMVDVTIRNTDTDCNNSIENVVSNVTYDKDDIDEENPQDVVIPYATSLDVLIGDKEE